MIPVGQRRAKGVVEAAQLVERTDDDEVDALADGDFGAGEHGEVVVDAVAAVVVLEVVEEPLVHVPEVDGVDVLGQGEAVETAALRRADQALEVAVIVVEALREPAVDVKIDLLHSVPPCFHNRRRLTAG